MSGLEAKEINLTEVTAQKKIRIDSEFYKKEYIRAYEKIEKVKHFSLLIEAKEIKTIDSNGFYDFGPVHKNRLYYLISGKPIYKYPVSTEPDDVYFIRTIDLDKNFDLNYLKYTTKIAYDNLFKTNLFGGELLIKQSDIYGKVYLMPKLKKLCTLGPNIFMIKFHEFNSTHSYVSYIFFKTKTGRAIMNRNMTRNAFTSSMDMSSIKGLPIPIFSEIFSEKIKNLVLKSVDTYNNSKKQYIKVKDLYIALLNKKSEIPASEKFNIKTLKETFYKSKRLDSEFFQPKYNVIFNILNSHKTACLKELVHFEKSKEPGSAYYMDSGTPFIRISDLSKTGIKSPNIYLRKSMFFNIGEPVKEGTILLTKDGNHVVAYKATHDLKGVTSSGILQLTLLSKNILPDYLTFVLNSFTTQLQREQAVSGSIIEHWAMPDIEKLKIPILDLPFQKLIVSGLNDYNEEYRNSKNILNIAITAVEQAITEGEKKALDYLSEND